MPSNPVRMHGTLMTPHTRAWFLCSNVVVVVAVVVVIVVVVEVGRWWDLICLWIVHVVMVGMMCDLEQASFETHLNCEVMRGGGAESRRVASSTSHCWPSAMSSIN
jgi:hypothetical protein